MRAKPVLLVALVVGLLCPATAGAVENLADEPPFGGAKPPPLVRPPSAQRPPPGFNLSAQEAIRVAERAAAVADERGQSGPLHPVAYARGSDEWQIDFYAGPGAGTKVAEAIVVDATGSVLGAWHDQQLGAELARGYSGAIAQKVNAPYVWLVLSVLFIAPFLDPRRLRRIVHVDLLVLLGLGLSLFFFNRGEITTSVGLTYPVLGYFLVRMLAAGLWPREREGPLVPLVPIRWLAGAAIALALGRAALNIVDSHVIDIGVAGVIGADHISHGQSVYDGVFSPGIDLRGDVYGPFNYLAYLPFDLLWPWHGTWGSVPAAHAAAIAFDLLTALGLFALGRRLRAGKDGRALGVAMAFAWLACPFTLYAMNANANDGLVAALMVGAMLALRSPPARGVMVALAAAARRRWRRCSPLAPASGAFAPAFSSAPRSRSSSRGSSCRSSPTAASASSTTARSATRRRAARRSASGDWRHRSTSYAWPSARRRWPWRSAWPSTRAGARPWTSPRWRPRSRSRSSLERRTGSTSTSSGSCRSSSSRASRRSERSGQNCPQLPELR